MNIILTAIIAIMGLVQGYSYVHRDDLVLVPTNNLGSISFPTTLDALTNPSATDRTNVVSHSGQHSDANDAIEALEAKMGINGSAVTSSLSYKLSGVVTPDKAVSLTGVETLTNKILTSPSMTSATIATAAITNVTLSTTSSATTTLTGSTTVNGTLKVNLGSDATGDIYYRNSGGLFTRLPVGSNTQLLTLVGGLPAWQAAAAFGGARVRAYLTSTQAISASTTPVVFTAETFDTSNAFSTSTGLFTAPTTAYYFVHARSDADGPGLFEISISVNNVQSSFERANPSAGTNQSVEVTDVLSLTAGDLVQIRAKTANGTNLNSGSAFTTLVINQL